MGAARCLTLSVRDQKLPTIVGSFLVIQRLQNMNLGAMCGDLRRRKTELGRGVCCPLRRSANHSTFEIRDGRQEATRMEQTLQARIREHVYHLWNDWCGQSEDNHYRLKERAVGIVGGSWLFALQRAGGMAKDRRPLLPLAG